MMTEKLIKKDQNVTSPEDSLIDDFNSKLKSEISLDNDTKSKAEKHNGRTDDIKSSKNLQFSDLGLREDVVKAIITSTGWQKPSPIQEELVPVALEGHDIVARAKNGTGKTGSFILPILNAMDLKDRGSIEALILAPTRELAMQISNNIIKIQRNMRFQLCHDDSSKSNKDDQKDDKTPSNTGDIPKTILLNGGQPIKNQILILNDHKNQCIKIAVATCGRAYDLARQKILPLDKIKIVALDEADRLFHEQNLGVLRNLMSLIPQSSQKILVSATFSSNTELDIKKMVPNAKMINLMTELSLQGITPYYCCIEEKDKVKALNTIFNRMKSNQSIIFVSSAARATALNNVLKKIGYSCAYIHSQLPQTTRNQIFNSFKSHHYRVMICTDIFKRGIDNANLNVVFNFDIPISPQHYLHRVGRAGRYGRYGISIDLVTPDQKQSYTKLINELAIRPTLVPETFDHSLYTNY